MYALLCTQELINYHQESFRQILLLSLIEPNYLLVSYRSSLPVGLCVRVRVCKCVCAYLYTCLHL